jgi:hypothetical protein
VATRKSSGFAVALFLAVAAMLPPPLLGQAFYGSVVGTISDQSGGAFLGAYSGEAPVTARLGNVSGLISFFGRSK